jgi:hypothetical protein
MQEQIDRRYGALQLQVDQRFTAADRALDNLKVLLDERYETQTKGADERFVAQQVAMKTAFDAADKAVQAALAAADRAAAKAEQASDKRFEAVNEFRGQLADQAATLLSRVEFTAQYNSLLEKVEGINVLTRTLLPRSEYDAASRSMSALVSANADRATNQMTAFLERLTALELRLTSRLDLGQGAEAGEKSVTGTGFEIASAAEAQKRARQSQIISVVSAVIAVASILVVIYIHTK